VKKIYEKSNTIINGDDTITNEDCSTKFQIDEQKSAISDISNIGKITNLMSYNF